jgi:hypothetical protein
LIGRWRAHHVAALPAEGTLAAIAIAGARASSLAVLRDSTGAVVLATTHGGVTSDDPRSLLDMVEQVDAACAVNGDMPGLGCEAHLEALLEQERTQIERWYRARAADRAAGGAISIVGVARRRALHRLAGILARTPLSRRHEVAAIAARARQVASTTIGAAGELVLGELATAAMPDDAWLRALAAFAEARAGDTYPARATGEEARVLAMILLLDISSQAFADR